MGVPSSPIEIGSLAERVEAAECLSAEKNCSLPGLGIITSEAPSGLWKLIGYWRPEPGRSCEPTRPGHADGPPGRASNHGGAAS
jgi:hypothetical protein